MNQIQSKLLIVALLIFAAGAVRSQTTTFTYQGKLTDGTTAANGTYDLGFALFDAASGGTQIGTPQTRQAVNVSNGVFTVQLDFGANPFAAGMNRFLEIAVKKPADSTFTTLAPRQPITAVPYAIRALNAAAAETATNALAIGGTAASNVIKEGDSRLTDERPPAPGGASYIQNQSSAAQTSANFSIDGTGAASVFNAGTQYNIGGNRVLSVAGGNNVFAGGRAGEKTTGDRNAFVGSFAGRDNTTGNNNSFVGAAAGQANATGAGNSFVGALAGLNHRAGGNNTFIGLLAGHNTASGETTGSDNTFLGVNTGSTNTAGSNNTIVGTNADVGANNLNYATAIGAGAVVNNSNTVVLGRAADTVRIQGNLNLAGTFTGNFTVPAANVNGMLNASQIPNLDAGKITSGTFGAARIPNLGASYIQNSATQQTGNFNVSGNGTAGGTLSASAVNAANNFNIGGSRVLSAPTSNLFVGVNAGLANGAGINNSFVGLGAGQSNTAGVSNSFFGTSTGISNNAGNNNSFVGRQAGNANTDGNENSFFGVNAGLSSTTGSQNVFLGVQAGNANTTGSNNTAVGTSANVGANNLSYATAIGSGAVVNASNTMVLGRSADAVQIPGNLTANGTVKMGAAGNLFAASGEENLRIARGHIQVSGGNATVVSGPGYTVTRNQTGVFTITFTTPFSSDIVLTPTVINFFNAPLIATVTEINNGNSVRVNVFAPNGTLTDPLSLLFIAVGVR